MTLMEFSRLGFLPKNQKVEFRNYHNCMSCKPIELIGKLEETNPQLMDATMWGVPPLLLEISHIFTDDDIIVICLKDSRGYLRNVAKAESEYNRKARQGSLYKRGY